MSYPRIKLFFKVTLQSQNYWKVFCVNIWFWGLNSVSQSYWYLILLYTCFIRIRRNFTIISFSGTPPLLQLGFLIIIWGSTPPLSARSLTSSFLVSSRNLSSWTSLTVLKVKRIRKFASYSYFEKIISSFLVVGLANVNIFQLISTADKSAILTCRIEGGHGSVNW